MKRQGFTLIELLAVIVVLAIIALIATPIVMNTIESSKKGATLESVRNMVHAAELYFISANPRYGKLNLLDSKLDYDGQKPELGEVEVNKNGDSRVYAYINGYCVTKEYDSELYASKTNKEECNWYATDNYETIEGTTFTLNNQKIKNYLIYGNSTQDTRSGKNLFDYSYLNSTYSINGLTMTSTDDVITINGTLNKQGNLVLSKNFPNKFDTSKTYTLKIHVIGGNAAIGEGTGITFAFALFNSTNTKFVRTDLSSTSLDNIASVTFSGSTFEGDENLHLLFQNWRLESTYNNYQVKIQIEEGSTATAYEPYGAMPSPEFPSEIKNTGDLVTKDNCASYRSDACSNIGKYIVQIKATGNNMFDGKATQGAYLVRNGNHANVSNYICNANKIYVEPATDYYISKDSGSSGYIQSVLFYDVNNKYLGYSTATKVGDAKRFTTPSNARYINFNIVKNAEATTITPSELGKVQLSKTNSQYESYKEKVTNIYLDEPLRKVGDYADYIDFNNKKVVRNIKEVALGKGWTYTYKNLKGVGFGILDTTYNRTIGMSNRENLIGKYYNDSGHYMWLGVATNSVYWVGILDELGFANVSEFNTWLKQNPTTIIYPLSTSVEESIDLPNIELLDGTSTLQVNTTVNPSNVKLTTSK